MNAELEKVIALLKQDINSASLDPLVEHALRYAYALGKFDGTQEAVLEMTRKRA